MSIHLVDELARIAVRVLLAAATLGFGAAGWLFAVHRSWQAGAGLVLFGIVVRQAFLSIWNEERDR